MADPVLVPIPLNSWIQVAGNIKTGNVWIVDSAPSYYHTYRDAGGTAPASDDEAVKLPIPGLRIESAIAIDVYILARGDTAGLVRVDSAS